MEDGVVIGRVGECLVREVGDGFLVVVGEFAADVVEAVGVGFFESVIGCNVVRSAFSVSGRCVWLW